MVFLGPIDIDSPGPHGLESTLHADRADINAHNHGLNIQHGVDDVRDMSNLHALAVRAIDWKHQHVAAYRDSRAAEDDDPIDILLCSVDTVRWRVIIFDDAAAAPDPF